MIDSQEAYLQVHIHPSLLRYQVVVLNGQKYSMLRMGFGLNIASTVMDMIIWYVTRSIQSMENDVNDLCVGC